MTAAARFPIGEGARLIDAEQGSVLEGEELRSRIAATAEACAGLPEGALFIGMALDIESILFYLGSLEAHRAVALLDQDLGVELIAGLVRRFQPSAVLGVPRGDAPDGYRSADVIGPVWLRDRDDAVIPHSDLAVLLPTSGSTGSSKLVRLSNAALVANALAITEALRITPDELAPTSLPLHYSYGLSVLNSHLAAGATVLVEPRSIVTRAFWESVAQHRASSFAGVPHHYEMLRRLRFDPARYPRLRTLTQAGGKMAPDRVRSFANAMHDVGGRLYVMYGQTEAAPRMSTLPADRVLDKAGSVGLPLAGGAFEIRPLEPGRTPGPVDPGEVVYRGPNVMMGYADSAVDLGLPDQQGGVLATGDLGYLDDDGFLYITGRLKRIGKIFGNRVNLDDVERRISHDHGAVAVVAGDDKLVVWLQSADPQHCKAVARELAIQLRQHVSGFDVRSIGALPLLSSGKTDYRALEAGIDG